MTTIEVLGSIFGLLSVWYSARASVWCWPTGLANSALFIVLFADARLYGDVITNVMFFVVGLYGWMAWRGGARRDDLAIHRAAPRALAAIAGILLVVTPLTGFVLATYTDAVMPYPDAAILVMSFVAQGLLTRKVVESWPIWVAVDVLAVIVYLMRGLHVTAGLYAVFLGLAIHGWHTWRRRV